MGFLLDLGNTMILVSMLVFVAILAGLMLHRIIGWYIEGAISGIACILIAGIYVGAIISAITARTLGMTITIALLIAIVSISAPIVKNRLDSKSIKALNNEKICQYRAAISDNPENLAARSMLAKTLYADGRLDEAIAELKEVVLRNPSDYIEVGFLNKLIKEQEERNLPR